MHRIGQTCAVNIHYLVAKGTLDERVWRMLERKLSVLGSTLNGKSLCLGAEVDQHTRAIALGGAGAEDAGTQSTCFTLALLVQKCKN